jgi:hypothetical protein
MGAEEVFNGAMGLLTDRFGLCPFMLNGVKVTRLPTSFLSLYSTCYVEFSITLGLYFINQHITGYHRIDVETIPCAPEQIKMLKTSKPFRNTCTSVDS